MNSSVKNLLRVHGLLVVDQDGNLQGNVKLLDYERNIAVLTDGTEIPHILLFTNLLDFDNRLVSYLPGIG